MGKQKCRGSKHLGDLGEVKLSRKREMRKTKWVGRCSWGAEEKRETFGVKAERFVALSTAWPTAAWTLASVILRDVHVYGARPEAARDAFLVYLVFSMGGAGPSFLEIYSTGKQRICQSSGSASE